MVLLAALAGIAPAWAAGFGPNTFRYNVSADLISSGLDTDAKGQVQVTARARAGAESARLRLGLSKLDPKTDYTLVIQRGEDTNFVVVTNFTTSAAGRARLVYTDKSAGARALPASLADLPDVEVIAILNTNHEVMLSLNLHEAEGMTFQLTSVLQNSGADPFALGCLAVARQGGAVQFRMFATGQSSEFTLLVNDAPVQTYQADASGQIGVGVFPPAAPSPLSFRKVALRNAGHEVVLESNVR